MEHSGKPHGKFDGFCVTYILKADSLDLGSKSKGQEFEWTVVTDPLMSQLRVALTSEGSARFIQL